MSPSPRIVRFVLPALTRCRLRRNEAVPSEARTLLHALEWTPDYTKDPVERYRSPAMFAEPETPTYVAIRDAMASLADGAEEDVTARYVLGYTTAPAGYDSLGTLSLEAEDKERLVAIRTEHMTWQVSRYASGLQRFRPVEAPPPPPTPVPRSRESVVANSVGVGSVVRFHGKPRRYVVGRAVRGGCVSVDDRALRRNAGVLPERGAPRRRKARRGPDGGVLGCSGGHVAEEVRGGHAGAAAGFIAEAQSTRSTARVTTAGPGRRCVGHH